LSTARDAVQGAIGNAKNGVDGVRHAVSTAAEETIGKVQGDIQKWMP